MTNLKLYGVVGRASSWEVKVEDSTAELLEVNSLLDIGKECYELKSMIAQGDLFMLNLCPAKKPILPDQTTLEAKEHHQLSFVQPCYTYLS